VSPRLRIEPEVQALWWETCVDEGPPIGVDCWDGVIGLFDVNGAVDLGNPAKRTVTYVIGGVGVRLGGGGGDDPVSSVSMHGGLGVRIWPSRRFFLAPEARFLFTSGASYQLAMSTGFAPR
jgi:hypothetical protein